MLPNNMRHQYLVTKKSVLRKLGGKEDECIISSDAELDAKLELFKSVNESCLQLQRVIDLYQERLCYLAQEENALGRYLKECGRNEKNASAGKLMEIAGKALAYTGHQRLTVRPPLVRLHQEVETFRGQGITDTRMTVSEMEKARTEYRAALGWMKSVSSQLDPDTGCGLESFRKAQSYVKTSKTKFDRYTLDCLEKIDLLAAARCNMFSHALVPYQNALNEFATKALETLLLAATTLSKVEPYDFSVVTELADLEKKNTVDKTEEVNKTDEDFFEDKDRNTFFNAEYTDKVQRPKEPEKIQNSKEEERITNLLGDDFSAPLPPIPSPSKDIDPTKPSSVLLDLDFSITSDALTDLLSANSSYMPSNLLHNGASSSFSKETSKDVKELEGNKNSGKTESHMSWLNLFAELDPLAHGVMENKDADDRA
ncbi:hypothetical protein ABEB36_000800 [Hypothenemus hampei]|uniref:AH domain-containing protein n=1 Tax=Hypothenemus hampei TaxID=57062 RepID=A0ABD1FCG3_HYPHA